MCARVCVYVFVCERERNVATMREAGLCWIPMGRVKSGQEDVCGWFGIVGLA